MPQHWHFNLRSYVELRLARFEPMLPLSLTMQLSGDTSTRILSQDSSSMALLTWARRENVQAMHWREIELKSATWKIKRTKNGQLQNVLLTPTAIDILIFRKDGTNDGFVFPSQSESGHITDPKKALIRVLEHVVFLTVVK